MIYSTAYGDEGPLRNTNQHAESCAKVAGNILNFKGVA